MDQRISFSMKVEAPEPGTKRQKGQRTRSRLKQCAAQLLVKRDYSALRISDICHRAGISQGTFYRYFQNKQDILIEVLSDFDNFIRQNLLESGRAKADPYEAIKSTTRTYIKMFRENAGLMKCLIQFNDDIPQFQEIFRRQNHEWALRTSKSLAKRTVSGNPFDNRVLFVSYCVGAMVDEMLSYICIHKDPHVISLFSSDEELTEILSLLQFRAAYGANPPAEKTALVADLPLLKQSETRACLRTRSPALVSGRLGRRLHP